MDPPWIAEHLSPGFPPRQEPADAPSLLARTSLPVSLLALLFLSFLGGALAVLTEVFPAGPTSDAYRAGVAVINKVKMSENPLTSDFWKPERTQKKGVTINTPEASPGYTLYSSGHRPEAFLIALDGTVVQQWNLKFGEIWGEDRAPVKDPMPDTFFHRNRTRLMPNGDLLAIFEVYGDTPWSSGMVKLDKDSNVIWSYLGQTHHDFDVAHDGRVYALTHEMRDKVFDGLPQITVPRLAWSQFVGEAGSLRCTTLALSIWS